MEESLCKIALESAPKEVRTFTKALANPQKAKSVNACERLLLYGEPGTGKTTLAKAIAQTAGARSITINAPFLANEYKDSGSKNIQALFEHIIELQKETNNVILIVIDELHTICDNSNPNNPDRNMPEALWLALDKCRDNGNIFFIGITNYKNRMAPQLQTRLKGSEVEIKVENSIPLKKEMINVHLKGLSHNCTRCLDNLAKRMSDFTPRQIEECVRQAGRNTFERNENKPTIQCKDFEEPLQKIEDEIKRNQPPNATIEALKDLGRIVLIMMLIA